MQVKLFWVKAPMEGKGLRDVFKPGKANDFERRINQWLSENPKVEIQHIKQSASGGSTGPNVWLVSVWYRGVSS